MKKLMTLMLGLSLALTPRLPLAAQSETMQPLPNPPEEAAGYPRTRKEKTGTKKTQATAGKKSRTKKTKATSQGPRSLVFSTCSRGFFPPLSNPTEPAQP